MSYLLNIKVDLFSIVDLLRAGLQVLLSQTTHTYPAVSACLTPCPQHSALWVQGQTRLPWPLYQGACILCGNRVSQVIESLKNHGLG